MKVHSDTDCVAVDAQVARLEARHERDTQALQSVWDDFHVVEQKRDEARAANAALAAALRELGFHARKDCPLRRGGYEGGCNACHAALPDTGEGGALPRWRELTPKQPLARFVRHGEGQDFCRPGRAGREVR